MSQENVAIEKKIQQYIPQIKLALVALVLILVFAVVSLVMKKQKAAKSEEAFAGLFLAERIEKRGFEESSDPFTQDFWTKAAKWKDDKKSAYRAILSKVVEDYPSSVAAALSSLRLGHLAFAEENLGQAKAEFQKVADMSLSSEENIYVAMALEGLALSLEEEKKWNEAVKVFDRAIALDGNTFKSYALLGKARNLVELKNKEEAMKLLDRVLETEGEKPVAQKARAMKALITVGAAN